MAMSRQSEIENMKIVEKAIEEFKQVVLDMKAARQGVKAKQLELAIKRGEMFLQQFEAYK